MGFMEGARGPALALSLPCFMETSEIWERSQVSRGTGAQSCSSCGIVAKGWTPLQAGSVCIP